MQKSSHLVVRVIAGSSKTEIIDRQDNELKVKLKSIPEKGKANKELIDLLAKDFGIKKNKIEIVKGKTSGIKLIKIR